MTHVSFLNLNNFLRPDSQHLTVVTDHSHQILLLDLTTLQLDDLLQGSDEGGVGVLELEERVDYGQHLLLTDSVNIN